MITNKRLFVFRQIKIYPEHLSYLKIGFSLFSLEKWFDNFRFRQLDFISREIVHKFRPENAKSISIHQKEKEPAPLERGVARFGVNRTFLPGFLRRTELRR
ncbi:MAG TPA: hypothetical protein PKO33_09725, partial [Pyrinomonadaceae bacterium]|nr:hypothetical protein [Pyrinomonadaceae bacterium]